MADLETLARLAGELDSLDLTLEPQGKEASGEPMVAEAEPAVAAAEGLAKEVEEEKTGIEDEALGRRLERSAAVEQERERQEAEEPPELPSSEPAPTSAPPQPKEAVARPEEGLKKEEEEISNWQAVYNRWREARKPREEWSGKEAEQYEKELKNFLDADVMLTEEHLKFLEDQGVDVSKSKEKREEIEAQVREERREEREKEKLAKRFFERVKRSVKGVADTYKNWLELWKRDPKLAAKGMGVGGASGFAAGAVTGAAVGAASVALAGTPLAAVAVGTGVVITVGYLKHRFFDKGWLPQHIERTFVQRKEELERGGELDAEAIAARIEADKRGYLANCYAGQIVGGLLGTAAGGYFGRAGAEWLLARQRGVAPALAAEKAVPEATMEVERGAGPTTTTRPEILSGQEPLAEVAPAVEAPGTTLPPASSPAEVGAGVVGEAAPPEVSVDALLNTKLEGDTLWGSLKQSVEKLVEANPQDQFVSASFESGVTSPQWTADAICDVITRNGASIPEWQGKTIAELLESDPEFLRFISRGLTTKDPKKLLELFFEFKKYKTSIGI